MKLDPEGVAGLQTATVTGSQCANKEINDISVCLEKQLEFTDWNILPSTQKNKSYFGVGGLLSQPKKIRIR